MKPTKKPGWNPQDVTKVVEPSAQKRLEGWSPGEKPKAEHFNFLVQNISEWIDHLDLTALTQADLDTKVSVSEVGVSVAPLSGGKIPANFIPNLALTSVTVVQTLLERDALAQAGTVQSGDAVKVVQAVQAADGSYLPRTFLYDGSAFILVSSDSDVDSVQGKTGVVTLVSSEIPEAGDSRYFTPAREQEVKAYADSAVLVEAGLRQAADAEIEEAFVSADSALNTALTSAYQAADAVLSTTLTSAYQAADVLLSETLTSAYEAADAVVTSAYQAADTSLSATLTSAYQAADTSLSATLTSAYQAADTALSEILTSAYQAADTALSETLTSAYQAADTSLSATLTSAYQAADAVVTSAYQAADTSLSATLTSAYQAADTALNSTLTSAYQAADTAKLAEAKAYTDSEILENVTDKLGVANGIATLGSDGKVPAAQLPASGGGLDTATVRRFELAVNGPYYVNGVTTGNDAILFTEVPYKMAVTSAPLRVFLAGTSGSLEVNVEYSTDGGSTWTSLYTTKPVVAFGAGNFATNAGTLTAQSVTLVGGTLLRLNLGQVQQGADGFAVNLVHTQVA